MKNILTISAASLVMLAACNHKANDSKAVADSINSSRDSGEKVAPNSRMEISGDDAKFAVDAANGGLAEVELGKLAQQKATNQQVKDFGAMMVNDHSKANAELKQLAADKKIALPDSIASDEKHTMKDLSDLQGADFDKAYVQTMVKDHEKDIKLFEESAKKVKYPQMLAFIKKTLPVLHMHLQAAQKLNGGK